MARTMYGSFQNRIMENRQIVDEITVGMGMTEYFYTDREAYEVVEVKDQKHVSVRRLDHIAKGGPMSNEWELVSNPENAVYQMTKRGKYWYYATEITADLLEKFESGDVNTIMFFIHNDVDPVKLREKGKLTKYHKANVTFGHASYYYDYEF